MFSLRFPESSIGHWASRNKADLGNIEQIGLNACNRGFLTHEEFVTMCASKSPRTKSRCAKNSAEFVREVTKVAFTNPNEQLRIQVLTLLNGVAWPTASYLLHFCSNDPYPILDFRALWSVSCNQPTAYDFSFWWSYTEYCRGMATRNRVTMRVLDSALWQYSNERQ